MKEIEFEDELPVELKSCNPIYVRELKKQAKVALKFQNYKPVDDSLGCKTESKLIQPEVFEKETSFRLEKQARAFFSDSRAPLKIIPKKPTLDIETKLKPRFDRLKLRTEMAIVRLLKEKLKKGDEVQPEENGVKEQQDAPMGGRKSIEEDERITEFVKFQEIEWLNNDRNDKNGPLTTIALMEKIYNGIQNQEEEDEGSMDSN